MRSREQNIVEIFDENAKHGLKRGDELFSVVHSFEENRIRGLLRHRGVISETQGILTCNLLFLFPEMRHFLYHY